MTNLPSVLQFTDDELRVMTLKQMRDAFTVAEKHGVLQQFTDIFWKNVNQVRSEPSDASVTNVLRTLEDRKRAIGRKYDAIMHCNLRPSWLTDFYAIQYNDLEYQIRWLCDTHHIERHSHPYLLREATKDILQSKN